MPTRTTLGLIVLASALGGAACHHRVAGPAANRTMPMLAPAAPPFPAPPAASATRASRPLSEEEVFARKSLEELNAEHPLKDAFFDYDQNTLRDDTQRALQQDAQWLSKWSQTKIRIDGHCDERGSAEYNLALGERRSAAVRKYLVSLGVSPDRIETRSLGLDAPFCRDTGESCWSQNRRGHFEIIAK